MIMNEENENLDVTLDLLVYYRIRRLKILPYHSQWNEQIERSYDAIVNSPRSIRKSLGIE